MSCVQGKVLNPVYKERQHRKYRSKMTMCTHGKTIRSVYSCKYGRVVS